MPPERWALLSGLLPNDRDRRVCAVRHHVDIMCFNDELGGWVLLLLRYNLTKLGVIVGRLEAFVTLLSRRIAPHVNERILAADAQFRVALLWDPVPHVRDSVPRVDGGCAARENAPQAHPASPSWQCTRAVQRIRRPSCPDRSPSRSRPSPTPNPKRLRSSTSTYLPPSQSSGSGAATKVRLQIHAMRSADRSPRSRILFGVGLQTKHKERVSDRNGNVLLTVNSKRNWDAPYSTAKMNIPKRLAVFGVQSKEVSFLGAREHHAARRGEQAGPSGREQFELPFYFSGGCLEGPNRAPGRISIDRQSAPSGESCAGFVRHLALEVDRAHFASRLIEEFCLRTIACARPVGCALDVRKDEISFHARIGSFTDNRTPLGIEAISPCLFRVRPSGQKLARLPIQHVIEPVPIGLRQEFAFAAAELRIKEHQRFVGIPIVNVMRRELEIPLHLSVVWIERENRASVEIVALSLVPIPIRCRIARAPIQKIQVRIE